MSFTKMWRKLINILDSVTSVTALTGFNVSIAQSSGRGITQVSKATATSQYKLIKREKDHTRYLVHITQLEDSDVRELGGRWVVGVLSPGYGVYVLNLDGYLHQDYIAEKYPNLTRKDAENVTEILNNYFRSAVQ
jgi:hypothetical protein